MGSKSILHWTKSTCCFLDRIKKGADRALRRCGNSTLVVYLDMTIQVRLLDMFECGVRVDPTDRQMHCN